MKVAYRVSDDCTLEVDVANINLAFRFLSQASEIFGVKQCGRCQGKHVRPDFRQAKTTDGKNCEYYSIKCLNPDCRAEYKFGQRQDGKNSLFPKGWHDGYVPANDRTEQARPRRRPQEDEYEQEEYAQTGAEDDGLGF